MALAAARAGPAVEDRAWPRARIADALVRHALVVFATKVGYDFTRLSRVAGTIVLGVVEVIHE